jgi:hypothetical protein
LPLPRFLPRCQFYASFFESGTVRSFRRNTGFVAAWAFQGAELPMDKHIAMLLACNKGEVNLLNFPKYLIFQSLLK